jgi:N-acetylglucosaminyldiphosphoundecaprenol N-acetyl-beta-D-mannosaminyltransferase
MLREFPSSPQHNPSRPGRPAVLAGLSFHRLSEAQVVHHIVTASQVGQGGWVATPNIDICRQTQRDESLRRLVASASLIVPDGMPLIWAARLVGEPLPERVTGASLIFSLTQAAADRRRSIYLLGGAPGVPERAGEELRRRYPGLVVAGTDAPPMGFDADPQAVACVRDLIAAAAPDIVYVGLGFPKQERLIARLAPSFPGTWFVSCGAAISFAANALPRAPLWMQSAGLEWAFRLISEPRRLYRRYLLHDLPFAVKLLGVSAVYPFRRTGRHARVNTLKHHPLGAKSQLAEMLHSPAADITAERRELQVTPRHFQAESLPVPPSLIPSRPASREWGGAQAGYPGTSARRAHHGDARMTSKMGEPLRTLERYNHDDKGKNGARFT